jgi:hypothetical protein
VFAFQEMVASLHPSLEAYYTVFGRLRDSGSDVRTIGGLFDWVQLTDFFRAPASTRYHGNYEGGLVQHSVGVLLRTLDLIAPFGAFGFKGEVTSNWFVGLVVAALFHDLCKADLYDVGIRNVKNEQGVWNKEPYYKVKDGATGVGHGTESLRRISKFVQLPYEWELAVAWHMGSYGLTSEDNIQYMNACRQHPEVLMLHTADMMQVSLGGA